MTILYFFLLVVSALILFRSSIKVVENLSGIARYLRWKKFIVAFLFVAIISSIPNLIIGLNSALRGIPQLSLADVFGGNVIDLTLAVALPILVAQTTLPTRSRIIQKSAVFTVIIVILPLLLLLDGRLDRIDGLLLLLSFIFYVYWIFSKEERFKNVFRQKEKPPLVNFNVFLKNLSSTVFYLILLVLAVEGMIRSAIFLAGFFNLPLSMIGILVIGFGNALPEIYFSVAAAKQKQREMILGNLMGSIIVPSTLVLALVAFISPIEIDDFSPFAISRAFLLISALLFGWMIKTDRRVTRKEAYFLLAVYLLFVGVEILTRRG